MTVHSSSRAGGRVPASPVACPPLPAAAPLLVPSASRAVPDPGAMVDSPTSNRFTAKRTGARGSADRRAVPGEAAPLLPGDGAALAAAPLPPGVGSALAPAEPPGTGDAAEAGASPSGVTVYTPSDWVAVNVSEVAPGVPAARSTAVPSGRVTFRPLAPAGIASCTGLPGETAPAGAPESPRSSPTRLDRRIGKPTWRGRSDRRRSKARTAEWMPARTPAYSSGASPGPRMIGRAQSGRTSLCAAAMWVVDRST